MRFLETLSVAAPLFIYCPPLLCSVLTSLLTHCLHWPAVDVCCFWLLVLRHNSFTSCQHVVCELMGRLTEQLPPFLPTSLPTCLINELTNFTISVTAASEFVKVCECVCGGGQWGSWAVWPVWLLTSLIAVLHCHSWRNLFVLLPFLLN